MQAIKQYAAENQIPMVHFERGQRKDDLMAEYRLRFDKPEGVVLLGVAQEKAQSLRLRKKAQSIECKKALVRQYFKEGRALRTETIINDPKGFRIRMDLSNLPFLRQIGREVNRRLLDVQRINHNCHLPYASVE